MLKRGRRREMRSLRWALVLLAHCFAVTSCFWRTAPSMHSREMPCLQLGEIQKTGGEDRIGGSRGFDAQNARCCCRRVRVDRAQWGTLPLGEALSNLRPGKKEKTQKMLDLMTERTESAVRAIPDMQGHGVEVRTFLLTTALKHQIVLLQRLFWTITTQRKINQAKYFDL